MTPTTPTLPEPATGAMKVELQRMTPGIFAGDLAMFPSPEGKYVRLSDAQALAGEVERLRAEVAALKGLEGTVKDSSIVADAERYRWLRDPERGEARGRAPYVGIENDDDYPNRWALFGDEADAALDASRAVATQEAKA